MVLRKHLLATLGTGLLPALSISLAHAMTVQPVKVKSALGEPFYAEIVISDLGQIDIRDIQVSLANNQDLSRLGLSGSELTNSLNLSLLATQNNNSNVQGVIVIRSQQPINDPYLEFAVKIQAGSNNRIQRVNALIDPRENKKIAINLIPIQENNTETPVELATSNTATIDEPSSTSTTDNNTETSSNQALLVSSTLPPEMGFSAQERPANEVMTSTTNKQAQPKEVDISTTASKKQRHLVQRNESLWKIAKQLQPQMNKPIEEIMQHIRDMNHDAFISGNPNQLKRGATLVLPDRDQNATLVNNALPPKTPKAATKLKTSPTQAKVTTHRGRLPKAEMTLVAPTTKGLAQGNSANGRSNGLQPLSRELSVKVGQERRKAVLMQHEVSELDAQLALNDKKIAMLNAKLAEMEHQLKMRNQSQKSAAVVSKKVSQTVLPLLAIVAVALSGISPNVAQAADGDGGGFPIWIIPLGILIVAVIIKLLQGKAEPAANKRTTRAKAKRPVTRTTNRPTATQAQPAATPVAPQAPVAIDRTTPVTPVTEVLEDVQNFIDRERFTDAADILKQSISEEPNRSDLQIKLLEVYALENATAAFEQQYQVVAAFNQPNITAHADKLRQLLEEVNKPNAPDKDAPLDFTPSLDTSIPESATTQNIHAHRTPTLPMDQSLADLEAEFGFDQATPTPQEATTAPTANDNVMEFDLSGFETTKSDITDLPSSSFDLQALEITTTPKVDQPADQQPVDLEFDLSDSFDLAETTSPIAPPVIAPVKEDAPSTPASTEIDLSDFKLEDTNWASGFDDQEFDIGSTPTTATTSTITPSNEPSTQASTAQDADGFLLKEFPFLVSLDVQQTNLELAESYINLGEHQSAKELLEEVLQQGSAQQQTQAQQLIRKLAS